MSLSSGATSGRIYDFRDRGHPPRLTCCRPLWRPFPSGYVWQHAGSCIAPGRRLQKVRWPEDAEWIVLPEHPSRDLLLTALSHPLGHRCTACDYFEAHVDDDDDDGRPTLGEDF